MNLPFDGAGAAAVFAVWTGIEAAADGTAFPSVLPIGRNGAAREDGPNHRWSLDCTHDTTQKRKMLMPLKRDKSDRVLRTVLRLENVQ
jgi:hypothetical protein